VSGPVPNIPPSWAVPNTVGLLLSCEISFAYGSNRTLLGLNLLPLESQSEENPDELFPLFQEVLYGQFGPHTLKPYKAPSCTAATFALHILSDVFFAITYSYVASTPDFALYISSKTLVAFLE